MKIAVFGNLWQDHRVADIRKIVEAVRGSGAFVEVEQAFGDYLCGLVPDFRADKVVGELDHVSADVVLSIGGDGTFLRAAAWVGCRETPIVGINTGHLGYLAEFSASDLDSLLSSIKTGEVYTERRTLLQVSTDAGVALTNRFALNDVAIIKNASASMLAMHATIDSTPLTTYLGDGLIVATPTGSTAYNLSVGGPIIHPSGACLVMSPIAAHSLTMRPLVLPDDVEISIHTCSERSHTFRLSIDGESLSLPMGSTVKMRKADFGVRVVLRRDHDFAQTLRSKLMWGIDVR